jgi:hypothetical protein
MSEHGASPQAARAQQVLTGLGIVADVTAVVALVTAPSAYVAVAAALATLAGVYILVRGWGRPFGRRLLLGVVSVVAGVSALSVVLVPSLLTTRTSAASAGGGGAGRAVQMKLVEDTGVDLDGDAEVRDADGANGPVDLFLKSTAVAPELRANNSDFVDYSERPGTAPGPRCAALLDRPEQEHKPSLWANAVSLGYQFCFRTSDGVPVLARVNDAPGSYLVLNVTR